MSDRSQGRSSQVSGLPKRRANSPTPGDEVLVDEAGEDRVAGVVGQAVPAELGEVAGGQVARAPAGDPGVQGDHDAAEAGRFGPGDQAGGQVPVGRRVQLEETGRSAEPGGHVLHRVGGQGRCDHRDAGTFGCVGGGQVAVPVLGAQADHADGRHQQRGRQPHPEQFHGQVTLGRADEHARDQAPLGERADVGPLGVLAARAAGHVGQHRRRQRPLGPRLELGGRHREAGQDPLQPGQVDLQLVVPEGGHLDIKAHAELQPFCT